MNKSIDVTDISIIIGLNKYDNNIYKLIMKYWNRYDKKGFNKLLEDIQKEHVTTTTITYQQQNNVDKILNELCDVTKINIENKEETANKLEELIKNNDDKPTIDKNSINSFCNKHIGINNEHKTIKKYEKDTNCVIKLLTSYNKKNIYNGWCIGGKIDGIIENKKIIEIKNRINHIYYNLPIYEIVQLFSYMYIFSLSQATLIEHHDNEIKINDYNYSYGFENNVIPKLIPFCNYIDNLLNDDELKYELMKYNVLNDNDNINIINDKMYSTINVYNINKLSSIKNNIIKKDYNTIMVLNIIDNKTELIIYWRLYDNDLKEIPLNNFNHYKIDKTDDKNCYNYSNNSIIIKEQVLSKYLFDLYRCSKVISYNIKNIISIFNKTFTIKEKYKTHCIKEKLKDVYNLKNPKLEELYYIIFKTFIDETKKESVEYINEIIFNIYVKHNV